MGDEPPGQGKSSVREQLEAVMGLRTASLAAALEGGGAAVGRYLEDAQERIERLQEAMQGQLAEALQQVRTSQEERNAALARAAEAEKAAAQARREFEVEKEELGERVRGLDDLLEGTQDQLSRAEKTLTAKTEALTKQELEAKQDSQRFQVEKAKLETALSTSEERVKAKESEAAELETALSTSEERVKAKESEAAELETALSTSEERVKAKESEAAELETALTTSEVRVKKKEAEAAELAAALAEATRRKGVRERTRNLFARIRGKGSKDRFGNFRRSS